MISRRHLIQTGALGSGLLLTGCDRLNDNTSWRSMLEDMGSLHHKAQRLLIARNALAREYTEAQMSPNFRVNGSTEVATADYRAHQAKDFSDWTLRVEGLVKNPLQLTMASLQAMPQRSQITRHDCVEGWSAIGKWQGPQLGTVLKQAGLLPAARFLVFHCADILDGANYYESIDLIDGFHPQTILAWRMNDMPLTEGHGAPIRLRVERQLGYKQAKYVMRIEAKDTLAGLYGGKGGLWEDRSGYQWYAGI